MPLLILGLGAALAHAAQRTADADRHAERAANRQMYVPSPVAVRVASLGHSTLLADGMWVRAVLSFADAYHAEDGTGHAEAAVWLRAYLETISALDPLWRTAYYHGGGMLRVLGDAEGSDAIFALGMKNLPDEPYFPFSLAMNAYLLHQDRTKAAAFLGQAAAIPGAPPWYRAAAAGFLSESGQRQTALRYLKEQLDSATEPTVRRAVQRKLDDLLHEEFAAQIEALRPSPDTDLPPSAWGDVPPDPYQAGWIIGADGRVRSAHIEDQMRARQQQVERRLLLDRSLH